MINTPCFQSVLNLLQHMSNEQLGELERTCASQKSRNMSETSGLTDEEWTFITSGNLLSCVKSIRDRTGLGMVDAKKYMDKARRYIP